MSIYARGKNVGMDFMSGDIWFQGPFVCLILKGFNNTSY